MGDEAGATAPTGMGLLSSERAGAAAEQSASTVATFSSIPEDDDAEDEDDDDDDVAAPRIISCMRSLHLSCCCLLSCTLLGWLSFSNRVECMLASDERGRTRELGEGERDVRDDDITDDVEPHVDEAVDASPVVEPTAPCSHDAPAPVPRAARNFLWCLYASSMSMLVLMSGGACRARFNMGMSSMEPLVLVALADDVPIDDAERPVAAAAAAAACGLYEPRADAGRCCAL